MSYRGFRHLNLEFLNDLDFDDHFHLKKLIQSFKYYFFFNNFLDCLTLKSYYKVYSFILKNLFMKASLIVTTINKPNKILKISQIF